MSERKFKFEVGLWFTEEVSGTVEADSYEEGVILATELMRELMENDVHNLESEVDRHSSEIDRGGPQGYDVDYFSVSVTQDYWMRPV